MNQKDILEFLIEKFDTNDTPQTFIINGKWGVGKTYIWKFLKEKYNNRKMLRVSIFGKDKLDSIIDELKITNIGLTEEEKPGFFDRFFDKKSIASISIKGINLLSLYKLNLNSKDIILYDDLERHSNKLDIKDILGTIENNLGKCNQLILINTEQLNTDELKIFNQYKEKICDRELNLSAIANDIKINILNQYNLIDNNFQPTIISIFNIHGRNNLRILRNIALFVSEISIEIILNENIVKVAAAIVIENSIPDEIIFQNLKKYNSTDLIKKYQIEIDYSQSVNSLQKKYTENILEKEPILNIYKKANKSKIHEHLKKLTLAFYLDSKTLKSILEDFLNQIRELNFTFFEDLGNLLLYLFYFRYFNKKYIFFDNNQSPNDEAIFAFITENLTNNYDDYLKILEIYNNSHYSNISSLVGNLINNFETEVIKTETENYKKAFKEENFGICLLTLNKNPKIIENILESLDILLEPLSEHKINFVNALLSTYVFAENKALVIEYLSKLKLRIEDKVVLNRIENIIIRQSETP